MISSIVTGGQNTVAVRIPQHVKALELLDKFGIPLCAPSANPANAISATTAQHVYDYFKNDLSLILDGGPCLNGIESTIIGLQGNTPVLYRHGAISIELIEKELGIRLHQPGIHQPLHTPGMSAKHYAPNKPLLVSDDVKTTIQINRGKRLGLLTFKKHTILPEYIHHHIQLSEKMCLEEAARKLYASLYALDKMDVELIIVEKFPDEQLGKTLNDRINRAAVM